MERRGEGQHGGGGGGFPERSRSYSPGEHEHDLLLQWGNRKRLRCVKIQVKSGADTTVRVDRRVVRSAADKESPSSSVGVERRRTSASPSRHRMLRNSEVVSVTAAAMTSPQRHHTILIHEDRAAAGLPTTRSAGAGSRTNAGFLDDLAHLHHHHTNGSKKGGGSILAAQLCGLSSSGSEGGRAAVVWPRFEIALSNKEKEEDFFVFKGCTKLPQRPKKRAKCIQKTLNLVCPGTWLCDLTQERYEVREKKVAKKRPRGLKAMGSMDSDSE